MSTHVAIMRKTVAEAVEWKGKGLHGGQPVICTLHPSESGIKFQFGSEIVAASPENVTDTTRSTKLGGISTIEHLMSALAALAITDVHVELSSPELPGLDGSALPYIAGIKKVGVTNVGEAEAVLPFKRVFYAEDGGIELAATRGEGHWRYVYDLGERWPNQQICEVEDVLSVYEERIAPARTFALAEEVPMLLQAGLAQGLDTESALIVGIEGYKNNPRFETEPSTHKLLDLIGDLYLSGLPIRYLNVSAAKSGHRTNVKFAQLLKTHSEKTP